MLSQNYRRHFRLILKLALIGIAALIACAFIPSFVAAASAKNTDQALEIALIPDRENCPQTITIVGKHFSPSSMIEIEVARFGTTGQDMSVVLRPTAEANGTFQVKTSLPCQPTTIRYIAYVSTSIGEYASSVLPIHNYEENPSLYPRKESLHSIQWPTIITIALSIVVGVVLTVKRITELHMG